MALDPFLRAGFDHTGTRIGGMKGEAPVRLALQVEGQFCGLAPERKFQARELRGERADYVLLDLLLQFCARRRFERRNRWIAGVSNKSPFGPGFDAVSELSNEAFQIHAADSIAK